MGRGREGAPEVEALQALARLDGGGLRPEQAVVHQARRGVAGPVYVRKAGRLGVHSRAEPRRALGEADEAAAGHHHHAGRAGDLLDQPFDLGQVDALHLFRVVEVPDRALVSGQDEALAVQGRGPFPPSRIVDGHHLRIVAQVVAAMVLGVEPRLLVHVGEVVYPRVEDGGVRFQSARTRERSVIHGRVLR